MVQKLQQCKHVGGNLPPPQPPIAVYTSSKFRCIRTWATSTTSTGNGYGYNVKTRTSTHRAGPSTGTGVKLRVRVGYDFYCTRTPLVHKINVIDHDVLAYKKFNRHICYFANVYYFNRPHKIKALYRPIA